MVPEMNLGQLSMLLRAKYLVDVVGYNHVRGLPLRAAELADAITELIETTTGGKSPVDTPPAVALGVTHQENNR
jgi:2-oxoglutarate ferredoxin oxidoreductase subunit alpha